MTKLTKSERFLLNEVDSCPDKVARLAGLRQAAVAGRNGLSYRGFSTVLQRLEDGNLLGRTDTGDLTLTFGGMTAMRANGMQVQE